MDLGVDEEGGVMLDNGGTRSGKERRQITEDFSGEDKRTGKERRGGVDRRSGMTRRNTPDRRNTNLYWDGSRIERRDAFRK
jgi:hypothetical protein